MEKMHSQEWEYFLCLKEYLYFFPLYLCVICSFFSIYGKINSNVYLVHIVCNRGLRQPSCLVL